MMAGMWGVKLHRDSIRELWRQTWFNDSSNELIYYDRNAYSADQAFLERYYNQCDQIGRFMGLWATF